MAIWQNLYLNMILSYRIDRWENTDLIQLVFSDIVEKWGIPDMAYLDNGRAFASKRLTGGSKAIPLNDLLKVIKRPLNASE